MKTKYAAAFAAIGIVSAFAFSSCNKFDEIGTGILPKTDNVNLVYSDTTTIVASTVAEDTLRANGFSGFPVSYNIVGSYPDPIFGRSDASPYMQMDLSKFNFSYGAASTADSLILCLTLVSWYGDTTAPMHFKIYRMDERINTDSAYYTSTVIPSSTLIGDAVVTVHPHDSTPEYGVKKPPHIRIPLNISLATELMSKSGGPEYVDNVAFGNYFKGIYITAQSDDPNKGCLFRFDYKNIQSKMTLYYKATVDSDSLSFNYTFDELARFNHFDHYYTGTEAGNALSDNTSGKNYIYIQSMAGVKGKINLPYIKSYLTAYPASVINNAVLVFKTESNTTYPPHSNMFLAYVDSLGKAQTFSPDNADPVNSADGTYNSSTNEYRFNITRYLNQVITDKRTDYGIFLEGRATIINFNRTRIFGTSNPAGKIRLELTYSKF